MFEKATSEAINLAYGIGIAIRVTVPEVPMMHVGILYTPDDDGPKLLHLAMHDDLKCEAFTDTRYHWSNCEWLGAKRYLGDKDHLLNFIENAAKRTDMPYGYRTPRRLYDGAGERQEIEANEGLTCATFIARLFADASFPIVDLGSWQPRKDDARGSELIMSHIEACHPERYAVIKDQEMPYRLRPHEAATAAASTAIPMVFADAEHLSRPLYDILVPTDQNSKRLSDGTGAIAG